MTQNDRAVSLMQAARLYLGGVDSGEVNFRRQVINQFIRWFGRERLISAIVAEEIANYAQRMSASDVESQKKLDILRTFLGYAVKAGWTERNMAVHLKARKGKARVTAANKKSRQTVSLTGQGYQEMQKKLVVLKDRRPQIVEEIRKAAADKDFRENAPLHAAKERMGHLEGKIMELEETIKSAVVIDEEEGVISIVSTGNSVVLLDLSTNEKLIYQIVGPREVNPAKGRISNNSPIGKAIIGCKCGDIVEIEAPVGKLSYRLEKVEH